MTTVHVLYKCVENHFEELERAYPEGQKLG